MYHSIMGIFVFELHKTAASLQWGSQDVFIICFIRLVEMEYFATEKNLLDKAI